MMFRAWLATILTAAALAGCGAPGLGPTAQPGTALAALGAATPVIRPLPVPVRPQKYPISVVAHRGYSKVAPENTLAAFEAAIAAGADAVELDVRHTRDGRLVVIHDAKVDRTTNGRGEVSKLLLSEIKQFDAGAWFDPRFAEERVPTLDEALALIRGRVNVIVELKVKESQFVPRLVVDALERHGLMNTAMVISFYGSPLIMLHKTAPALPTGALVLPTQSIDGRALATKAGTALAFWRTIQRADVEKVHARKLKLHAWTVNDPEDLREQIGLGVDGLITDDVKGAFAALAEKFDAPAPVAEPVAVAP